MHPIVIPVAVRGRDVVGAKLRPDRPLTIGKRRADRIVAYMFAGSLLLMSAVSVIAVVRLHIVEDNVRLVIERCVP